MTLDRVLGSVRGRWLLVLIATLVGLSAGAVVASQTEPTFDATSVILLRPSAVPTEGADHSRARYAALRANDYRFLVQRTDVLNEAIETLELNVTPAELRERVSTDTPWQSPLLLVRATSNDPEEAARTSVAVARALSRSVEREEAVGLEASLRIEAPLVVTAVPATRPIAPRNSLYLSAGMLAGTAIGLFGAIVLPVRRMSRHVETSTFDMRELAQAPGRGRLLPVTGAHVVWLLIFAAAIPWRTRQYYDGGLDPVVLSKAALAILALSIAWLLVRSDAQRRAVAALPVLLVGGYLVVTVIGGLANHTVIPAVVVAARVAIFVAAVSILVTKYGMAHVTETLVYMLTLVVLSGAITGLPAFDGRLWGGIPALHPNSLAAMSAVLCVWLWAKVLTGRDRRGDLLLLAVCAVIVFLTGSRTSLSALIVAVLVMLFRSTRMRPGTLFPIALAAPPVVYLILGTTLIESIALRGGSTEVMMLSNRRIAWEAAFGMVRDGWQTWFGQGLAHKHVPVSGQFWAEQLLDSSWISAWVQGGVLGLFLFGTFTVVTILRSVFRSRTDGPLWLGLAVLLIIIGVFESGLFDASVNFLVFFTVALGSIMKSEPQPPSVIPAPRP